ncbi:hypothetical protein PRZ48_011013 [Zasmidium cellare]|uniref:PA14 domain-containing protein n=1 Tax=Zasmidium cellare TaxID=395010 RepID=A0ABR0EAS7_ZASCE|nr:hypothetical protein PRZ48_011013 [Zasmidium cellare]
MPLGLGHLESIPGNHFAPPSLIVSTHPGPTTTERTTEISYLVSTAVVTLEASTLTLLSTTTESGSILTITSISTQPASISTYEVTLTTAIPTTDTDFCASRLYHDFRTHDIDPVHNFIARRNHNSRDHHRISSDNHQSAARLNNNVPRYVDELPASEYHQRDYYGSDILDLYGADYFDRTNNDCFHRASDNSLFIDVVPAPNGHSDPADSITCFHDYLSAASSHDYNHVRDHFAGADYHVRDSAASKYLYVYAYNDFASIDIYDHDLQHNRIELCVDSAGQYDYHCLYFKGADYDCLNAARVGDHHHAGEHIASLNVSFRPGTTVTATTTAAGMLPAPSLCGNQGLQYGAFVNNQPAHDANRAYTLFDPTFMKAASAGGTWQTIYYTNITTGIGGFSTTCPANNCNITIYNSQSGPSIPCFQFALNHRGYYYIYSTGTWTLTASGVDDAFVFWAGPLAQSGWTKQNANISLFFSYNTGTPRTSITMQLTQGQYLPIRLIHGQATGGAGFFVTLSDPNGITALDSNTLTSPYLVQFSCDRTTAPPFANAIGSEI